MVFMTYANVVYSYGTERYAQCVSGSYNLSDRVGT